MLSLYPGCHAKVERTKMVLAEMTPLLLELWLEQQSARTRTSHAGFQRERAGNSSSAAGIRRSSKQNCEAWRVNIPELIDVVNGKALLVAREG
jgi:hypothetical protein